MAVGPPAGCVSHSEVSLGRVSLLWGLERGVPSCGERRALDAVSRASTEDAECPAAVTWRSEGLGSESAVQRGDMLASKPCSAEPDFLLYDLTLSRFVSSMIIDFFFFFGYWEYIHMIQHFKV